MADPALTKAVNDVLNNARSWGELLSSMKSKAFGALCASFAIFGTVAWETVEPDVAKLCLILLAGVVIMFISIEGWKRVAAIHAVEEKPKLPNLM